MKKIKISYLLPIHITQQHNQLITTINEISTLIQSKKKDFDLEETSEDFVDLNNDQYEYLSGHLEDHRISLDGITQTLFRSLFVSIYSHLETDLSSLIKEIENSTESNIKSKHLKKDGSYINCCFNYLTLVQKLDLTGFNTTIKHLHNITLIRNVFTHTRGILPKENNKLKKSIVKFIKKNDNIELKGDLIAITNEKFITTTIKENKDFLLKLINFINS